MPIPFEDMLVDSSNSLDVRSLLLAFMRGLTSDPSDSSASNGDVELDMSPIRSPVESSKALDSISEAARSTVPGSRAAMTSGWFRTRSGKNEFSSTMDAPYEVLDRIVRRAPSTYVSLEMKM
jgi:hypothetical protein